MQKKTASKKTRFDLEQFKSDTENLSAEVFCSLAFTNIHDDQGPLFRFLISQGVSEDIATKAQEFFAERNAQILARKKMARTFKALERMDSRGADYLEKLEARQEALVQATDRALAMVESTLAGLERMAEDMREEFDLGVYEDI